MRGKASAKTVRPQVQVVERQEVGATRVNQILGFRTIAKVDEGAIDHRVVNGDDLLRTMPGATFGPREN